jgi:2-polyprenyl-3-methyl-5-hydroxy-6-metoxy-1,4-benzoquinol methylase
VKNQSCSLCCGPNVNEISCISFETIKNGYKKIYDISIDYEDIDSFSLIKCSDCGLMYYSPAVTGDELFYRELQKNNWYYLKEKPEFQFARKFIDMNSSVLEIGSGSGYFGKSLNCKSYTGLELSASAIEMGKELHIEILNQTIQEHAKAYSEKYDVVCFFQVLEHVDCINEFVKSAIQCLKKGGTLIISVPNENSFLKYELYGFLNMPPHHLSRWNETSLRKLGEIFGLEVLSVEFDSLDSSHYLANAQSLIHQLFLSVTQKTQKQVYDFTLNQPIKFLISLTSRIIYLPQLLFKKKITGHSVTFVYKKK